MPFEQGKEKTGGRKPGSKNKKTEVAEAFVEYIVEKGKKEAEQIWKELPAKDKMDALIKLMDFVIPKHARVENTNKLPTSITVNLIPASPERLEQNNTIDISHEEIE